MENYLLISDAAREVQVESHVLRYWEDELHLPIRRNELGHRYYTREDIERFKQIKSMKERGLQLKAIKMILKDGKLDVMLTEEEKAAMQESDRAEAAAQTVTPVPSQLVSGSRDGIQSREEKAQRLQWLLRQMMCDVVQENNRELCRDIRESIVKELDYQFRVQEEQADEREKKHEEREELHYQQLDELLRRKSRLGRKGEEKQKRRGKKLSEAAAKTAGAEQELDILTIQESGEKGKRKRHSS